ncbi:hypothetical protein RvY_03838-3 [Ramazzottius varieornatus]|nr:hypothetical protein RvY_03838-3 [Ramazzottius varieornatus]
MEVYSLPACSINWESTVWTDRLYVAVVFSLGLVLPLSVILHSYIRIFQIIRQLTLRSNGDERMLQQHIKLIRMIFVMVLTFCITWLPYGAEALIITFGQKEALLSPDIAVTLMLLAKACVCCNPVVYAYMNSEVRKALGNWKADIAVRVRRLCPL